MLRIATAERRSQDRRQAEVGNEGNSKHETPRKAAATSTILLPKQFFGQWRLIAGLGVLVVGHITGQRRVVLFLVGLTVAAILHGTYDWLLGVQSTFAALVIAGSFVLFYAYLSKLRLQIAPPINQDTRG